MNLLLEESWEKAIGKERTKEYFNALMTTLQKEYAEFTIYPYEKDICKAFTLCPFEDVRVVLLGQDPYHGESQATGLSFGVEKGTPLPPSLRNIFKEVASDTGISPDTENGDLSRLAEQGVLLLNSTLTVRKGAPGSHKNIGWEQFTDAVIRTLSDSKDGLVFILWGTHARAKGAHIDRTKHLVIESAHPSPLSAYAGFFGSKPFTKTNEYLRAHGHTEIDWQ